MSQVEIEGVSIKDLKSFPDDRGFFRELIRVTDPFFAEGFGQWSHSKMANNTVKAWHFHHQQVDWWYVPIGVIIAVLFDYRKESSTFGNKIEIKMGEGEVNEEARTVVVKIPPGVLHGCKVLSETAHLFYVTSKTYNPEDEGRYPFDSEIVPHSWGEQSTLIVSERDRRTFIPPHQRERCR